MRIEMTKDDYLRLTGRSYELLEKRRPGAPEDRDDGGKTAGRDKEPSGDAEPPTPDEDDAEEVPPEEMPADDDEVAEPGEDPDAAAAAPVGPPPEDDSEKPLPPNKDGMVKGSRGKWPTKPTNALSASKKVPRVLRTKMVRE